MRFEATGPAMHSLAALGTPISRGEASRLMHNLSSANSRYDEVDLEKVSWSDLEQVSQPVAYEFWTEGTSSWLWHGVMVLDSRNHTVYVRAFGD